jgi:hypothetical protein
MFYFKKSIFIGVTLSITIALILFFQMEPIKAGAQAINLHDRSSEPRLTKIQSFRYAQSASTGLITGMLSYPSERIPPLTLFAIRIDNQKDTYYSIQTSADQSSYSIRVDPGVYLVLAYNGSLSGGYTRYVTCGMGGSCRDHILHQVVVEAGDILNDIDLMDWYAPGGTFPARPDQPLKPADPPDCSTYHRVAWGETLYRIGLQYNLTWKPIANANNLSNPNLVFAGQVLCIPKTSSTSTGQYQKSNIPTFEILSVIRNKRVTIQTNNFPPHTSFVVTMGRYGTKGINGFEVTTTDSGDGGSFTATYSIPQTLKGQNRIAIRLQSSAGHYSYNWFYNNTTN